MEYLIFLILVIIITTILFWIFEVNKKEIEKLKNNTDAEKIVAKMPSNIEIAKDMLKQLGNKTTKVENSENKGTLYIALTDKILIGKEEKNYTRVQTLIHECIHSIQNKRIIKFNFWFSNIYLLYFFTVILLTTFGIIENSLIFLLIFVLLSFVYFTIRMYLEMDAMTKAPFITSNYIEKFVDNKIITTKEKQKIDEAYEIVNKKAIPTTFFFMIFNCFIKIMLYTIIAYIFSII